MGGYFFKIKKYYINKIYLISALPDFFRKRFSGKLEVDKIQS